MSENLRIPVEGMTCGSCAARITRAVRRVHGVETVRVDLGDEVALVGFDPTRVSLAALGEAISRAGYEPHLETAEPFTPRPNRGGLLGRLGIGR